MYWMTPVLTEYFDSINTGLGQRGGLVVRTVTSQKKGPVRSPMMEGFSLGTPASQTVQRHTW